jgi:hypothetical protein
MSAENAANSSGAAANATRAKDDSNESTVPVTPRANGGGGSGSSGSKRLASQTSPLEAERRRLAEEFDGSYWNSASLCALCRVSFFFFFFLIGFFLGAFF